MRVRDRTKRQHYACQSWPGVTYNMSAQIATIISEISHNHDLQCSQKEAVDLILADGIDEVNDGNISKVFCMHGRVQLR